MLVVWISLRIGSNERDDFSRMKQYHQPEVQTTIESLVELIPSDPSKNAPKMHSFDGSTGWSQKKQYLNLWLGGIDHGIFYWTSVWLKWFTTLESQSALIKKKFRDHPCSLDFCLVMFFLRIRSHGIHHHFSTTNWEYFFRRTSKSKVVKVETPNPWPNNMSWIYSPKQLLWFYHH